MKKHTLALIALILISSNCYANPSGATSRRLASYKPVTAHFDSAYVISGQNQTPGRLDYAGLATSASLIYSITLTATASNATLALFDDPIQEYGESLITSMTVYPIWELGSATAGNSVSMNFSNSPLPTYRGISLTVKNGQADVAYE